jgi:gliding motility-associated-like protein
MYESVDFNIYEVENGVGVTLLDSVLYVNEGESRDLFAGDLENMKILGCLWDPATWLEFPVGVTDYTTVTPFGDITYAVTGYTIDGCKEHDTLHIIIRRPIKPYTGFSPNADGFNDTWEIDNAVAYGDLINVRVYNRWGEVVFESRGYDTPWDGTRNGRQMPVGSYFYIIDVKDGNSKPYTGIVTILR